MKRIIESPKKLPSGNRTAWNKNIAKNEIPRKESI